MPKINGKNVDFVTGLTNRQKWDIAPVAIAVESAESVKEKLEAISWDDLLLVFRTMIKEWQFEGEPDDPEIYDTMNFPDEIVPLFQASFQAMGDLDFSSGEAESGRT